ncbi:MAG: flagellar basal body P-ring protein FlgI [Gemmataceae bacterium]
MTRHADVRGLPVCAGHFPLWLLGGLGALALVLAGCGHTSQHRGKAEDEAELNRYDITTLGDKTTVGNADPIPLGGVGLVEGLEGTGGDCNHDSYRTMLADNLRKAREENVNELLRSPNHALVIVEAQMPPGAANGEQIDVEVKLPPGSKVTSLRGGYLRKCFLFNFDFAKNLRPDYQGGQNLLLGHKLAVAEGPILIPHADGDEAALVKQGRIWSGAKTLRDYPLALVMNGDSQRAAFTSLLADRINSTFQPTGLQGHLDSRIAHTKDNVSIALRVPSQYRHNLLRYLRVVRMIPINESADTPPKEGEDRRTYRQKVSEDLLDPSRTVVAALRLEALGPKSIPVLKDKGLKHPHPLVRFCSAEALAYLGSPACGEELHAAVVKQPMLRAFGLTALASLNEAICHLKLKELIVSDLDDETRYGAFRALRTLNPNDPLARGEQLNDSFYVHRVAPDTRPFVHISTTKRAEVVMFGQTPRLKPPFSFLAGEFAVTATEDDTRCTVSRFPVNSPPARRPCSLDLDEVLKAMAELGAQYPDVIALMQQANTCDSLTCRIRVDALPQAPTVQELVQAGKGSDELLLGHQDLGGTPTLYQVGLPSVDGKAK